MCAKRGHFLAQMAKVCHESLSFESGFPTRTLSPHYGSGARRSRFDEHVQAQSKVVNAETTQGDFVDRTGRSHCGHAHPYRALALDHSGLAAIRTRVEPRDTGPPALRTPLERRDTDRDDAARCGFVAAEQDLEVERLDPLGLGNVQPREVA